VASVLVVFLFKASDEAWHFDGRNESFALSLAKSHESADGAIEVFRHVARNFPPVEHLADDFENVVRSVRVLRPDFRMNRLDVGADNRIRQSGTKFRENEPTQG